jgi:hypothetical protein
MRLSSSDANASCHSNGGDTSTVGQQGHNTMKSTVSVPQERRGRERGSEEAKGERATQSATHLSHCT